MSEVVKKPLKITETVLRDAHQSLIATRMTTEQMLPIVDKMDKVGYNAVECWGGATFDACLRFLKEDPWDRLRKLRDGFKNTKLQMLFRGQNILGYRPYADDVVEYFVQKSIANGIDIIRIFDCLNDIRNLQTAVTACNKEKGHAQVALSYTLGDAYTLDYWMDMAKRVEDMGADSLCIKDMAGIGRPYTLGRIVANIKEKYPEIPIQYHSHAGPGFNVASIMEVCNAGCDYIDVGMEPLSWGTGHADLLTVQAMLKDAGYKVPEINMEAYMKVRALVQEFMDDFLGLYISPKNRLMNSLLIGPGLPGGMMGSMMADLKGVHSGINMILKSKNQPELSIDDLLVMLFDEVEYVWPKLGYPPLVTPFSQYVKNVALMNVMQLVKGEERWTMIDNHTWDMILGKSGRLPGKLAPEIVELAKSKGYEFVDTDPQSNYPDALDEYRKEMDENGWEYGEDDEELFELAMHDRQYRDYKSGVAKKRFRDELERVKDASMAKSGYSEEEIKKLKRAKADPIIAPSKGQVLWEVSVEGPSSAPFIGRKYQHDEVFCYVSTPWGEYEKVMTGFTGRVVEVCAQQGANVNKGDVIAYIQRSDIFA